MLYTHITEFTFKRHVLAPAVGGPPEGEGIKDEIFRE